MTSEPAKSLDVETDRPFQERVWRFQRFAWVMMVVLMFVALAGLTGKGGYFAHATAEAGRVKLDYPRISRWQSADGLTVTFPPDARGEGEILLPREFTDVFSIESADPQPAQVVATTDGLRFRFDLADEPGPKTVSFAVRAARPAWWTGGEVRTSAGATAELGFIVLP